eukprot:Cvel_8930.t1-p1 / transcript=Cvel_8930.t1 / gene=Cvel_8930 / organism=Chromera_velia_CCMP2878 / gene_product=hypothetical protein / transcript_product=hypothetical protein / location=Cvel_scaffold503:205-1384(-) / protein_length=133 / sequence_SO=supercontig / SO=protein_coding / is_pseudo=false
MKPPLALTSVDLTECELQLIHSCGFSQDQSRILVCALSKCPAVIDVLRWEEKEEGKKKILKVILELITSKLSVTDQKRLRDQQRIKDIQAEIDKHLETLVNMRSLREAFLPLHERVCSPFHPGWYRGDVWAIR